MMTAAISSRASVRAWKPPVSTSMTTGRKPRKRRAANSEALMEGLSGRCEAPAQLFAGTQRDNGFTRKGVRSRNAPFTALQGDLAAVHRQPIEARAEFAGKGFQSIQCTGLLEDLRIEFHRGMCRVDAGTAA